MLVPQPQAPGREAGQGQRGQGGEAVAQHTILQGEGGGPQDQQQDQAMEQRLSGAGVDPGRRDPAPGAAGIAALPLLKHGGAPQRCQPTGGGDLQQHQGRHQGLAAAPLPALNQLVVEHARQPGEHQGHGGPQGQAGAEGPQLPPQGVGAALHGVACRAGQGPGGRRGGACCWMLAWKRGAAEGGAGALRPFRGRSQCVPDRTLRGGSGQAGFAEGCLQQGHQFGQHRRRVGALQVVHQGEQGAAARHAAALEGLLQQGPPGQIPQRTGQGLVGTQQVAEPVAQGRAVVEAGGAHGQPFPQPQAQPVPRAHGPLQQRLSLGIGRALLRLVEGRRIQLKLRGRLGRGLAVQQGRGDRR